MTYSDRIIAGKWKGRTLVLPEDGDVRPTKNRVRQAVFNMLGSRVDWDGMAVADICCGSGAWGLEAASRGAGNVWLVDKDVGTVEQNVRALAKDPGSGRGPDSAAQNHPAAARGQVAVQKADAGGWSPPELLDVVLADPPYASPLAQRLINRAAQIGRSGAWWAVETSVLVELEWPGFDDVQHRDYGGSRIWVARQG